jgi:hypothetical protein
VVPAGAPLAGFAVLPFANTRSVTILNTGGNPLLFGSTYVADSSGWPTDWGGSSGNVIPIEGFNCARIPVGASLTLDLGSFQERGNMGFNATNTFNTAAPTLPSADQFPMTVLWFSSTGGASSAVVTYLSRLGLF